jgi:hypothetical protein
MPGSRAGKDVLAGDRQGRLGLLDRKVVTTSGLGLNTACFEPNTLALLSLP